MPITTMGGQYFYNGVAYPTLQEAKIAEMNDSGMKIDTAIPATPGIATQPQLIPQRQGMSDQSMGAALNRMRAMGGQTAPKQYSGRGEVGMPTQGLLSGDTKTAPLTEPKAAGLDFKNLAGLLGSGMLSLSQDPTLQQFGAQGFQRAAERKAANRTVEMLRAQGQNDLADLIEKNPGMAKTAMTQFLQQKYGTRSGIKTSEVKIDPATGQMFVVETDPNTGKITRRDVAGAIGQTPEEKAGLETSNALKLADMKQSQTAAADAYKQFSNISSQIRNLETIKSSLNTGNARTGVIDQFLPAFTEATATLRSAANSLGIDVINSATFGALSATELRLALDTALPQGLNEPQLLEWVNKKLDAQKKLQAELAKQADKLASGVPYTQWVKDVVKPFAQGEQPAQQSPSSAVRVDY